MNLLRFYFKNNLNKNIASKFYLLRPYIYYCGRHSFSFFNHEIDEELFSTYATLLDVGWCKRFVTMRSWSSVIFLLPVVTQRNGRKACVRHARVATNIVEVKEKAEHRCSK